MITAFISFILALICFLIFVGIFMRLGDIRNILQRMLEIHKKDSTPAEQEPQKEPPAKSVIEQIANFGCQVEQADKGISPYYESQKWIITFQNGDKEYAITTKFSWVWPFAEAW
jgi:hypothetical protein